MGSLTSRPSIPRAPQPVYVAPQPSVQVAPPPPPPPPPQNTTGAEGSKSEEEQASERRESSLLSRKRGRASTILTSFRGTLSDTENAEERKTLLGE